MKPGDAPGFVGTADLGMSDEPFWMEYKPVGSAQFSLADSGLAAFVQACWLNEGEPAYTYVTLKRVENEAGTILGWHTDETGINYIWSDRHSTQFLLPSGIKQYPAGSILRLTPTVVHRAPPYQIRGWRTFIKLTFTDQPLTLYTHKTDKHTHLTTRPL
jgi:hypothetical protein